MRVQKALVAASTPSQESPQRLSLPTALRLFEIKVAPTASYGLPLVWKHLHLRDLTTLDRAKTSFLKRVLGLHSSPKNRIVYLLTGTQSFIEDVREQLQLEETEAFRAFKRTLEEKRDSVDPSIMSTPAMCSDHWKGPNRTNRHVLTRFSSHGYHHVLCRRPDFHEADSSCQCRLCNDKCPKYHATGCTKIGSLNALNAMTRPSPSPNT